MQEFRDSFPGDFENSLFHVMWAGNILKTIICYIPLVSECHFIATMAIFKKIQKYLKKSDFFFVFEKKKYFWIMESYRN